MLMPNEVEEGDAEVVGDANEPALGGSADDVEARPALTAKIPLKPCAKGIAEHNATHVHYWDWCPICVRACGVSAPHFKEVDRSEHAVPAVCADYAIVCRDTRLEDEADVEVEDVGMLLPWAVARSKPRFLRPKSETSPLG